MDPVELSDDRADTSRRRRWTVPVVVIAVLTLVAAGLWSLGGVASDDGEAQAVEVEESREAGFGAAAATTRRAESARVALRSSDAADSEPATGLMSFGPDGSGSFTFADSTGAAEVRALPDATYVRSQGEWIVLTHDEFAELNGIRFTTGQNPFLAIVGLVVDALDHAEPGSVRQVGADVSHGDAVTVHEASVDLRAALASIADVTDPGAIDHMFPGVGDRATVWLDEQGRARLVRIDGDEWLEVELWDFGVEVDLDVPPEAVAFDDVFGSTDGPEGDGGTERFCAEIAGAEPLFVSPASGDAGEWRSAGERMADAAPYSPATLSGSTDVLAERYFFVALQLDRGASIATVEEAGLRIGGEIEPWELAGRVEAAAFSELAAHCPPDRKP